MRILCVDDERSVLQQNMELCRALPQKPEVVGFTGAAQALEYLDAHSAQIALLDVSMPEMDGLTLAERILARHPETAVIFLTSHSEYAVDALRMHASGYILKPLTMERLAEEVVYARSGMPMMHAPAHVEAQTFGEFELLVDGEPVRFRRSKSKELLAYLIDRQGRGITRAAAFAVLWEDAQYDRSRQKYLDVVIRSLRQTLEAHGIGDIMELRNGTMRICPEKLSCDLFRFFQGDPAAIASYRGEYMNSYAWAALTEAYVEQVNQRQA